MADTLLFRGGSSASIDVASIQSRELAIDTDTDQIVSGPSRKKTVMEDSNGDVEIGGGNIELNADGSVVAPVIKGGTTYSAATLSLSAVGTRAYGGYIRLTGRDTPQSDSELNSSVVIDGGKTSDKSDGAIHLKTGTGNTSYDRLIVSNSGGVLIGGTLPSAPNIQLNGSDGSASFAGNVSLTGGTQATSTVQARRFATSALGTDSEGKLQQNTGFATLALGSDNTASGGSRVAFNLKYNGSEVTRLNYDGSADFAGDVKAGEASLTATDKAGVTLSNAGNVLIQRPAGATSSSRYVSGYNGNVRTFSLNGDGSADFAGSVSIGGTAAANTIDEYEEGTWTPSMIEFGGSSIPFTLIKANYVRVGEVVTIQAYLTLTAASNGQLLKPVISGAPFSIKDRSICQLATTNSTQNSQGYSSGNNFVARANSSIQCGPVDGEQLVITATYIIN